MLTKTVELAELTGILFGDGKLKESLRHGYQLNVWCNLRNEESYAKYICNTLEKLFNKRPSLYRYPEHSVICIQLCSKIAVRGLLNLGVPKTHGDMIIPDWIKKRPNFSKAFLRGLFDTDGCFVFQRFRGYEYLLLKFSMKSKVFAKEVQSSLEMLGFKPYISSKGRMHNGFEVVLRSKKDLLHWSEDIGTNNSKNLEKIKGKLLAASLYGETGI